MEIAMKILLKLSFSILLTLLLAGLSEAGGPKIKFEKLSHDYGKVSSGQSVSAEFEFRNEGDATLKIENLTASCGCTKAVEGKKEIPPRGTAKISAQFDTIGMKAGRKQKTIFVKTNDPVTPVVKLTLYADVVKEINVTPPSLNKKVSSLADPIVFPLNITDTATTGYKIFDAETVEGEGQVSLDPSNVTLQPKSTSHLKLMLKLKPEPNRSFYAGKVRLKTDHPSESEIEIPFLVKLNDPRSNP
jgi:hypothetical protein